MRRSNGPIVAGLVTFAVLLSACGKAEQQSVATGCIEVAHVGSQDVPIGSLRLCVGEKGRSQADSLLQNRWTFYFDGATFRRLNDFVIRNMAQGPIEAGREPQSSFAVSWDTRTGKKRYIVSPELGCTFLGRLIDTVTGDEYADFRRVGHDVMAREGCGRRSGSPK